jgi:type I restriction enzyme S subunit
VQNGDMLIGMDGEFNIAKWNGGQAYLNQRVCRLVPKDEIDSGYLFYFMPKALKQIEEKTPFVTVKHLSAKQLNSIEISLPTMGEQKHVAVVLDKVSELIVLRKQHLAKLDELVKSRFIELFGDEDYPHTQLINLIIDGAGLSYGIVQPGEDGTGDMGVLRPVDIVDGSISTASIKYIDRTIGDGFKKTELNGNELLITVRGTTGVTALTDSRFVGMNVTRGIAVIRYDHSKINPVYLNAYLNTDESQRYIKEHTRGATLQQINLSDLRVQEILVPPYHLQSQFAAFVEQVDKSKLCGEMEVAA